MAAAAAGRPTRLAPGSCPRAHRRRLIPPALALLASLQLGLLPAAAHAADPAQFGLASLSASLSSPQAGAHPDLSIGLAVRTDPSSEANAAGLKAPYAATRDLRIELPPGLIGDPAALGFSQLCTTAELQSYGEAGGGCPNASQIGLLTLRAYGLTTAFTEPVYMMVPSGGEEIVRFATIAGIYPTFFDVGLDTAGDYAMTISLSDASAQGDLVEATMTTWGVPADPAHDTERCTPAEAFTGCTVSPPRPPGSARLALLTNPTRCGAPLSVTASASSWAEPERFDRAATGLPPISGCDRLAFAPTLTAQPTSPRAGAPTGLDLRLDLPAPEGSQVPEPSEIRQLQLQLPTGLTLAPPAAAGLAACSDAQARLGSSQPAACPDAAKLGEAEFELPALPEPLRGAIYLRTPAPEDPYRLWLLADEAGIHLKLSGELAVDPRSGQIESAFLELPQVPLRGALIRLNAGARAPLANPPSCGEHLAHYQLVPWSGAPPLSATSAFTIDQGCGDREFSPSLAAGSTQASAGSASPFVLTLTRQDGEQDLRGFTVSLPPGLSADFAAVPLCPQNLALAGSCPASSRVGSLSVAAGPGNQPLWIPQPGAPPTGVYLAGPYRGAPFSLLLTVPLRAGPFDFGTSVTRAAIQIDPSSARARIVSDPFPQILAGLPIQYRTISVTIDRPGFLLNPTDCARMAVEASVTSEQGLTARPSAPFRVANCAGLGFRPRFGLRLSGATARNGHPTLTAILRPRPGDANPSRAALLIPHSELIDPAHLTQVCTRQQFASSSCPAASIQGRVRAWSPLLEGPLQGPLYLRESSSKYPDLAVDLHGQLDLSLLGHLHTPHLAVRASFDSLPDLPLSRLELVLKGGRRGLLVNSEGLCHANTPRAAASLAAHNGIHRDLRPRVTALCGAGRSSRSSARR